MRCLSNFAHFILLDGFVGSADWITLGTVVIGWEEMFVSIKEGREIYFKFIFINILHVSVKMQIMSGERT